MEIEINDADLVERIGSGDRDSESEFCRRMAPRVRLYGLRHLRDSAAADDLAQQVMITALEALRAGRLREPAKLASFVLGIRRVTVLAAGGSVQCTVTADDDLFVGRLGADLSGAGRGDFCLCDASGLERMRMTDIPFHADSGGVALQESITYAKAAASNTLVARLVARDDAGTERLLGEYTFNHTRTLPGPGITAWS